MAQYKKKIVIIPEAEKEYKSLPVSIAKRFESVIKILRDQGYLTDPDGKKLGDGLFEIRVRFEGQWRSLYAYRDLDQILILSFFHKQSQQTPRNEIKKALKRYKKYT